MKSRTCLLGALLLAGLLAAPAVLAGKSTPVSISYAGYGFNTSEQIGPIDDQPVSISIAQGIGTFGNSSLAVTVEFVYNGDATYCPSAEYAGYDVVDSNYFGTVLTLPDQSQLFGLFNTGWLCVHLGNFNYVGEASGIYVGGKGRFAQAGGTWETRFEGQDLDMSVGFRSINGVISGEVEWP